MGAARESSFDGRAFLVLVALVGTMVAAWILVTPPAGGPDEPAHLVRSAALVRGQLAGTPIPGTNARRFEVPEWLDIPTPCFALLAEQPATCAPPLKGSTEIVELTTSARDYPVWGHLLPGLGTLVPSTTVAIPLSRALSALIPVLLIAASLLMVRGSPLRVATSVLALTPMAWFIFAVVNPSAPTIAGGFALWTGLLASRGLRGARGPQWLVAAGWAALVLPRRDGLIWACAILAIWLVMDGQRLRGWWARLGTGPKVLMVVPTAITLVWGATSGSRVSRALIVVPVGLVAVEMVRAGWTRLATQGQRVAYGVGVGAAALVAGAAVLVVRPGGADLGLTTRIINDTGRDLYEAVGLMGWLDTPVPLSMVLLYAAVIGVLVGVALGREQYRVIAVAAVVLAVGLVASWVLELFSGNVSGTYWQGRYYLPLLMGVPLVLGTIDLPATKAAMERRLGIAVVIAALVVINVGLMASARRWAVGVNGSAWPWDWDTYGTVVAPGVLIVVHLVASVGLAMALMRPVAGPARRTA